MTETINMLLQQFTKMRWSDILDILLVAFLIYKLIPLFRSSGTARIARVVLTVLLIAVVTDLINLYTLSFLSGKLLEIGLIALIILFRPELRGLIDHMDHYTINRLLYGKKPGQDMATVIEQTVAACELLSKQRIGALVVFSRSANIDEYFKAGTVINGRVSARLLMSLFFPKAALHDGAVIIRDGQVAAAACVLPLSNSERISADLGTRHRAGVGITEVSDAVAVIVSEETGAISVAIGGMLKRHLAPQTLEKLLRNELIAPEDREETESAFLRLVQRVRSKEGGKNEK